MNIKEFFSGKYSHEFWRKLGLILITEFLGTLMVAWALRPVPSEYLPFTLFISRLGVGRQSGNPGAWVFMIGFVIFSIIGTAWAAYIFRQYYEISKIYAVLLIVIFEISMIGIAFVGIFDGNWPAPGISSELHDIGADIAFLGNTAVAVLNGLAIASICRKSSNEKRQEMAHPGILIASVIWLVSAIFIYNELGGPFWQWTLMFSLINYLFWMTRLYPENFKTE